MDIDTRCCGSGTCIVDPAGRCWCGQQWDGQKMGRPAPAAPPDGERKPASQDMAPPGGDAMNQARSAREQPAATLRHVGPAGLVLWRWARGGLVAVLSVLALLLPAAATASAERDARAVREVIEAQLQAFAGGDAQAAFAHASADIRAQFGDAANFMAMVQAGYPMLVKPAAWSFFVTEGSGGTLWQKLQVRDGAGTLWVATYQLQQQPDASWRINGCVVAPDAGRSTT